MNLRVPLPLRCEIIRFPIGYIIPSFVAMSVAGFSFASVMYALFCPSGVVYVLTLITFALKSVSNAFFTDFLSAFLEIAKRSLFSLSMSRTAFSVLMG